MTPLTHGSLFSGIGGFDIGAEQAGIPTLWNCEIIPQNRQILKKITPQATQYDDITTLYAPTRVDIISGGFPCQDISSSGEMAGIHGSRSGLWFEMLRVIREVRPKYVIIENSPNLLRLGFEEVLCGLSQAGYNAEWRCLSNSQFGYPHRRLRLYVIAYANTFRQERMHLQKHGKVKSIFADLQTTKTLGQDVNQRFYEIDDYGICGDDNGFPDWSYRIGAVGNAVNVSIAHYLFECIKHHYNNQNQV